MNKKFSMWIFFLGLFVAFANAALAARVQGRIVLGRLQGEVTLTENATKKQMPAAGVKDITQGWTVTTGKDGSVVLIFSNGASVDIGHNSTLNIEAYIQDPLANDVKVSELTEEPTSSVTKLTLTEGEIVGNVKKLHTAQGSTFDVETPGGAAGIRGTTFRIVFRPDPLNPNRILFQVSTVEGEVQVRTAGSIATNPALAVGQNKEVSVTVDVTVNPATGQSTFTVPAGTVTNLSPTTQAEITQVTTVAVQAAQAAVFTAPAPGSNSSTGATSSANANTAPPYNPANTNQVAAPPQTQDQTTSGDGS
jgi:hypothetical protein